MGLKEFREAFVNKEFKGEEGIKSSSWKYRYDLIIFTIILIVIVLYGGGYIIGQVIARLEHNLQ